MNRVRQKRIIIKNKMNNSNRFNAYRCNA